MATKILGLRPALEALIVRGTQNPACIQSPGPQEEQLMNVVRSLSRPNSARYGLTVEEGYVLELSQPSSVTYITLTESNLVCVCWHVRWSCSHQVGQLGFLPHKDYTYSNIGANETDLYEFNSLFCNCFKIIKFFNLFLTSIRITLD